MWNSWHFSFQRWRTGDLKSRCVRPLTNSQHTVTNKKIWKWNSTPEYLETFFRNSCPWAMTNEYQNGGGFENHLLRKLQNAAKSWLLSSLYETIIWNILEGKGRRKMNLSWWTKIGFKKGVDFWLEMKVLNLKESEQMMMICFCSIVSVCQFVKSNEHLRQLFPCLCQFSTLMFPPCCAIGNHWKVSNDVHPTTFCLNFYLHLLQRNSALQRKSGTELKN